jgi:hypothetical protein
VVAAVLRREGGRECARALAERPELGFVKPHLLDAYVRAGQGEKAAAMARDVAAEARRHLPAESPQFASVLARLGLTLLEAEQWAEAETILAECLGIREKATPGSWLVFNTRSMLGGALLGQRRFAEAEPHLRAAVEGLKQREDEIPPQARVRITEAIERLAELCEATDRAEEAARWRTELARRG